MDPSFCLEVARLFVCSARYTEQKVQSPLHKRIAGPLYLFPLSSPSSTLNHHRRLDELN